MNELWMAALVLVGVSGSRNPTSLKLTDQTDRGNQRFLVLGVCTLGVGGSVWFQEDDCRSSEEIKGGPSMGGVPPGVDLVSACSCIHERRI